MESTKVLMVVIIGILIFLAIYGIMVGMEESLYEGALGASDFFF